MNVQCHACIGGKSIGEDIRRLDYGVQVRSPQGGTTANAAASRIVVYP